MDEHPGVSGLHYDLLRFIWKPEAAGDAANSGNDMPPDSDELRLLELELPAPFTGFPLCSGTCSAAHRTLAASKAQVGRDANRLRGESHRTG